MSHSQQFLEMAVSGGKARQYSLPAGAFVVPSHCDNCLGTTDHASVETRGGRGERFENLTCLCCGASHSVQVL